MSSSNEFHKPGGVEIYVLAGSETFHSEEAFNFGRLSSNFSKAAKSISPDPLTLATRIISGLGSVGMVVEGYLYHQSLVKLKVIILLGFLN